MLGFWRKSTLVKDDMSGIAKLLFKDVSKHNWEQENLTKQNLDFTVESVRIVDEYVRQLMAREAEKDFLHTHFDNFVRRLGGYVGEVIKTSSRHKFRWYTFASVSEFSTVLDNRNTNGKQYPVLYSKATDVVICPLEVVAQLLEGHSPYPNLLAYVEKMIQQHA